MPADAGAFSDVARVAIIGGGFTGAVVAMHLARLVHRRAVITVVEPRPILGCGVAYSASDPAHRINVPASRMTVFADDPAHFDGWLRRDGALDDDPDAAWTDDALFPQRHVFGRYIASLLDDAARGAGSARIVHHRALVDDVQALPRGFLLGLTDGAELAADIVVLAVSHPPPRMPGVLADALAAGAPVIADPWRDGALDGITRDARVLILGTGLTMADAVASLARCGHTGDILAVSRRGLVSRGHAFGTVGKRDWFAASPLCTTALALLRQVRAQVCAADEAGQTWQAVFDDLRANAGRLWRALNDFEKRRVVRHLRPFWDVHRFRVAPQVECRMARLRAAGQLRVLAASLADVTWRDGQMAVRLRPRHAPAGVLLTECVDAVIVTTGPAHGSVIAGNGALASLARAGLVTRDDVGLGLATDEANHAVGVDGVARADLFVAGPLARGRIGELMGLPQVSEHAAQVGQCVAEILRGVRVSV